jgi:hypothetical protein
MATRRCKPLFWGWFPQGRVEETARNSYNVHVTEKENISIKCVVLPKNSGNLNRAPEMVVVCPSAARHGSQYAL